MVCCVRALYTNSPPPPGRNSVCTRIMQPAPHYVHNNHAEQWRMPHNFPLLFARDLRECATENPRQVLAGKRALASFDSSNAHAYTHVRTNANTHAHARTVCNMFAVQPHGGASSKCGLRAHRNVILIFGVKCAGWLERNPLAHDCR